MTCSSLQNKHQAALRSLCKENVDVTISICFPFFSLYRHTKWRPDHQVSTVQYPEKYFMAYKCVVDMKCLICIVFRASHLLVCLLLVLCSISKLPPSAFLLKRFQCAHFDIISVINFRTEAVSFIRQYPKCCNFVSARSSYSPNVIVWRLASAGCPNSVCACSLSPTSDSIVVLKNNEYLYYICIEQTFSAGIGICCSQDHLSVNIL